MSSPVPASDRAGSGAELKRSLGLTSAVMITVGSVIGSGIFLKPHAIAQNLPDTTSIYLVWAALGVVCLFGAFAYAELGAMFPEAGGQYAFLREGFGRFASFLYGWCLLLVINSGSIAALAVAFAISLGTLVPLSPAAEVAVATVMILILAIVNHVGVNWGALVQNVATSAKLGALFAIVVGGFLAAGHEPTAAAATVAAPSASTSITGLVAACVAIFWAYEGWYQLPFNAAELRRPKRDLPRGLILGIVILIVTYVVVNAVYLRLVPLSEMRTLGSAVEVPKLAIARSLGQGVSNVFAILLCISVFGAANPNLLSAPRALYAMAQDGLVPTLFMRVHPTRRTPTVAIWSQAIWAIVLVLVLKTFSDITDYVVFASLIFYGLTVASVFRLRRLAPDRPRPFRCIGYPLTPAVFILVVLFVDLWTLADPAKRTNALIGLAILAVGAVVYVVLRLGRR